MATITYEAVIATLIQDNQGMLPELSELVKVELLSELSNSAVGITVGELLALALAEIAALATVAPVVVGARLTMPAELHHRSSRPVRLAKLVAQAVESVN
ncbi:MAG: hypothetical protein EOO62_35810 [Hymenobacter sp.]|nr:MAG: hypothetical protein EOO62_35810 [Hymenobacter sp.]